MKVILLKAVPKVGKKDDIVDVPEGYARNALLPQRLAAIATPQAIKLVEQKKQNVIAHKNVRKHLLDQAIMNLQAESLEVSLPASDTGSLFSKIDEKDIASMLEQKRIIIDPSCITLPQGPIKKVGTHTVNIIDGEYTGSVTITINKK